MTLTLFSLLQPPLCKLPLILILKDVTEPVWLLPCLTLCHGFPYFNRCSKSQIQFESNWNYPLKGQSRGWCYLLVCQRGVLTEQLREVRDSGSSSRVDPFLLYRIQLLEGEVGGAQMCTHRRETHPAVHILLWALLIILKLQTSNPFPTNDWVAINWHIPGDAHNTCFFFSYQIKGNHNWQSWHHSERRCVLRREMTTFMMMPVSGLWWYPYWCFIINWGKVKMSCLCFRAYLIVTRSFLFLVIFAFFYLNNCFEKS